ncbi:uncharacterized protein SPSK_11034 [Sporothrix schenckii 1099-18]|uniref:Uncharacterized protein n=1 Tax=Sporothrix schenckii 1099-18 TaxID=1397361 RepID=A0A0F2MK59_SPOSC|nr:uncharacterized protein SPSK_11034 [Sporothrix schenckii 1099-18]KJR88571.1 hypothetical protein SPSK_11034 [Sporothrix schenckii 1099-18]
MSFIAPQRLDPGSSFPILTLLHLTSYLDAEMNNLVDYLSAFWLVTDEPNATSTRGKHTTDTLIQLRYGVAMSS